MTDDDSTQNSRETPDQFHARRRRERRDRGRLNTPSEYPHDRHFIYGLHPVRQALRNPRRVIKALHVTRNGLARLELNRSRMENIATNLCLPKELDRLVGDEAVHQGVVLETEPLPTLSFEAIAPDAKLLLVLDQITDPHNVGAIMRSSVALNADALMTTTRHSPSQTGVLAKAASGALELIDQVNVRNLVDGLENLKKIGFTIIGLDSAGENTLESAPQASKIAIVLGAEGKGLRQKTRATCDYLARLDMPGEIKSLNVSNAAVLAMYVARHKLLA